VNTSNKTIQLDILARNLFHTEFIGKIRDSLHSTIPFTEWERVVIDSPAFQRLRRIHQTAFIKYIFPGATHTRFEHSLGVMHIAGLLYASIISNQKFLLASLQNAYTAASPEMQKHFLQHEEQHGSLLKTHTATQFLETSPYLYQCVRFAALLHDCGHSPFSHSGEKFMVTWEELEKNLHSLNMAPWLMTAFKNKIENQKSAGLFQKNKKITHEVYTLFIVSDIFTQEHLFLSPQMGQDICAVLDLSIPPHQDGDVHKSGLQSLLHEIVSGEIDADRMDYLLRDSRECGVIYGHFDLERILDSIGFYLNNTTQQYHLAMRKSGISAFEDYLRARLSMYKQVYFHKTATACEAMLEHIKKTPDKFVLPLNLNEYLSYDDHNFFHFFKNEILSHLLLERKLWKKVYEESASTLNRAQEHSLCPKILSFLLSQNIPAELIETNANLTCFFPKNHEQSQKNNFKIILKDIHMLRYLEPVENHSLLVNTLDEDIAIKRIFIAQYHDKGEKRDVSAVQKLLSETVLKPEPK